MYDVGASLHYISQQIAEVALSTRKGREETAEVRGELRAFAQESAARDARLEHKVFGQHPPPLDRYRQPHSSTIPPLAPGGVPSFPSIPVYTVSSPPLVDASRQSLADVEELRKRLVSVETMTQQQSRGMGLVPVPADADEKAPSVARKAATFVFSVPGLIALTSLIAALTGLVAAMRGAPPPPPPPPVLVAPAVTR